MRGHGHGARRVTQIPSVLRMFRHALAAADSMRDGVISRAQALVSPLSGLLGDRCNRIHVVAAGTLLWGGMTAAIGMATTLPQVRAGTCAHLLALCCRGGRHWRAEAVGRPACRLCMCTDGSCLYQLLSVRRPAACTHTAMQNILLHCMPEPGCGQTFSPSSFLPPQHSRRSIRFACMQAMAWAAFTGVGLAMVVPAAMSVVADYYQAAVRGRAFGALFTVAALGERPPSADRCQ